MFESLFNDARTPRGALVASICLHGVFIALLAAFWRVRPEEKGVEVTFRPALPPPLAPPAGHKTRPSRLNARPVAPKVRPQTLIQPTRVPAVHAHAQTSPQPAPPLEERQEEDRQEESDADESGAAFDIVGGAITGNPSGVQMPAAPLLLGSGMSRPQPLGECAPTGTRPRPLVPEAARAMGLSGAVVVEYVVETDGAVANVALRTPQAPQMLFQAIKQWLESCAFSPSISGGRAVPVRVIQQFTFRSQ